MQETFLKAVASGLKLDAAKFLADFKNGDDWKTESEISDLLGDFISEKVKAANETARKTGRSESSAKLARLIKNSGFENPDGLQGEDLLKSFLEWKDEQAQHVEGDPAKFSKEELLKLPLVQSIAKEREAKAGERFAAEKAEWEKKVLQAENTRKGFLLDKALVSTLEKAKVNLGDTPEQKALRLNLLRPLIDFSRLEIGEGDVLKLLDKEGFETDFEKEILPIASNAFGIVTQDKNKGGSGAQGSASGSNGKAGEYVPVHIFPGGVADYNQKWSAAPDNATRHQVQKDWKFQQDKEAAGKTPA